jgi:hypothetical protein
MPSRHARHTELPDTVGYVRIRSTGSGQSAESIQQDIRTADRAGLMSGRRYTSS